ncbi:MAG: PIN domain-containing protein [Myxococcales bacterium]|nr:PIN domain-containing protein [Myxococcales bacterium]
MARRDVESPVPARLFIDSGAFLAFFSARDGHHAEADRLFHEAAGAKVKLLTSALVLAEVHRLLLHRAGIPAARAALERIEASRLLTVLFPDLSIHREAMGWIDRLDDQVITYTDAVSFALMKASLCEAALSFDHDFTVAGFALWRGR